MQCVDLIWHCVSWPKSDVLQPSFHRLRSPGTVAMPPRPKVNARAKANAKAKAKARVRQAARRLRSAQLSRANTRQKSRRQALALLNTLSVEVQLAARPLVFGRDRHEQVDGVCSSSGAQVPWRHLSRSTPQCCTDVHGNGGVFSAEVALDGELVPDESAWSPHKKSNAELSPV